ncbi:hypothetical protein ABIC42_004842 [Variovorax sp. 1133]|nr:hypothetical protein [Variovorax paradoxus]
MEPGPFQYFIAIAHRDCFSRSAQPLYVAHPAVSFSANEPYIGAFQTCFITRSQFSPMTRPISDSE